MKTQISKLNTFLATLFLAASFASSAHAEPPMVKLWGVIMYDIEPGYFVSKVCIGDQFYLITHQYGAGSGITPALRDGKPEQCDYAEISAKAQKAAKESSDE